MAWLSLSGVIGGEGRKRKVTRDEKYLADKQIRGKIKKAARLRDHPSAAAGERRACFAAVARLVKRLHFTARSHDKYWKAKENESS